MKKVYLAAPFFNELELKNMWYVADLLQKSNYDVYIPQKLKIENAWNMSNKEWAKAVFEEDIKALDMADNVVLMNYGINMDSGTAWEGGYAFAKSIPVLNICFKNNINSLMLINSSYAQVYFEDLLKMDKINIDQIDSFLNDEQK